MAFLACCLTAAAATVAGCSKPAPVVAPSKPDQTYTVRGRIAALPDPNAKAAFLEIHHETIPDFKDRDGKPIGMAEMSMPFPTIASGVSLAGLKPGDPIEFVMEIRWAEIPPHTLASIRRLPADTTLQLVDQSDKGR
jgi:Cu/Ag efflux protein CusF